MRIGIIGLGRMSGSIARRLMRAGHEAMVWDHNAPAIEALVADGAIAATSLTHLADQLGVESTFGDKLLSAMRLGFGGHVETSR